MKYLVLISLLALPACSYMPFNLLPDDCKSPYGECYDTLPHGDPSPDPAPSPEAPGPSDPGEPEAPDTCDY